MMNINLKLLMLGCGNMGAAIVNGFASKWASASIIAVDPNVDRASALITKELGVSVVADLNEVAGFRPDITMFAVKPQQFGAIASDNLLRKIVEESFVVSVMAGCSLETISSSLGHNCVARAMPNLPAKVGEGMTFGYVPIGFPESGSSLIRLVFETIGLFEWLKTEEQFDVVTAVAGSGPGFVFAFAQQLEAAAVREGLSPAIAGRVVAQTLLGSARMLSESGQDATSLKRSVASPGGTTEAGLSIVDADQALRKLVLNAVRAARERSSELTRLTASQSNLA